MFHTQSVPSRAHNQRQFSINKPFFAAPHSAGRKITAGFSCIQRISKTANLDVWFPDDLRRELDALVAEGKKLGPKNFPAQWAAVRQFELLQEAGNYKIYDMDATDLLRTLRDFAHNMRGGGYRVTVASIGSYAETSTGDELEILDRRLQDRISRLTHMLYLEEQSETINAGIDKILMEERWDYRNQLPHISMTLGAHDLFQRQETTSARGKRQRLSQHFFDILSLLPQKHIVHDTAVGLQLPESIAEHEWIYVADKDMQLGVFNMMLNDLFAPFGKGPVQHMRGYGDRLTPGAENFYRNAAASLHSANPN